jgi:hypothetical protein
MPEATVDRLGVVDYLLTVDDIASLVTTLWSRPWPRPLAYARGPLDHQSRAVRQWTSAPGRQPRGR